MKAYEIVEGPEPGVPFSAQTFLAYLRRSNPHWWDGASDHFNCPWVFRGHRDACWRLVPSAVRPLEINNLRALFERMKAWPWKSTPSSDLTPEREHAVRLWCAYLEALNEFQVLAVSLGLTDVACNVKNGGVLSIRWSSAGQMQHDAIRTFSVAKLAQHHGIPTFFLDWTKRAEIAAHFAMGNEAAAPRPRDVAIFALRHVDSSPVDGPPVAGGAPFAVLDDVPRNNRFLAAQHGTFTFTLGLQAFVESGIFPALEDLMAETEGSQVMLKKMILKSSEVPALRKMLDREELSDAHLMPSLDNVAKTIMSRWALP
jgi:FRG domain